MAIEPFRQKIGVPDGAGISGQGVGQIANVGDEVSRLAGTMLATAEPQLKQKAIDRAKGAAALASLRNPDGSLVVPERPDGGGVVFNQIFDQVVEDRYVNEVSFEFQNFLNADVAARRAGTEGKAFDPNEFEQTAAARMQGTLQGVDPSVRPQLEQTLYRETLERSRAFREEWSRTQRTQAISGINDQIKVYFDRYARFRDEGIDAATADRLYGEPARDLIGKLKLMNFAGQGEMDALLMQVDGLADSAERYTSSLEVASGLIPAIGGMGLDDLDVVDNWLRGLPDKRGLSGVSLEGATASTVTPDTIKADFSHLFPGVTASSFDRSASNPLSLKNPGSHHNVVNGGRAVDVPPIKGMTFEQYVQRWRDAGYKIVEAKEEVGAGRSAWATGDHWHVAFANTRTAKQRVDNPKARGITFDMLNGMDTSVRNDLLTVVTDRKGVLRQEAVLARQEAADAAREAREAARTQGIVDAINARDDNGLYGGFSSQERQVLDAGFAQSVDLTKLGDFPQQQKAIAFVQQRGYLPEALSLYMTNNIRSPNWQAALQIYRGIKSATTPHGQTLGDLFVGQLDARTRAILDAADNLQASGQPSQAISARIEQMRSGNGIMTGEAISRYNTIVGDGKPSAYAIARNDAMRRAFGISKEVAVPKWVERLVDESYSANLDVADGNPERALALALKQSKGVYAQSGVFWGGVGPSVLKRSFTNQQLGQFFGGLTDPKTGQRLVPPVRGKNHTIGPGGSIKLVPLDGSANEIGRYEVRLYDPDVPSRILNKFEIDLGSALGAWSRRQPRATVEAANMRKAEEARRKYVGVLEESQKPGSVVGF